MDTVTLAQILNEPIWISYNSNTLGKDMILIIFLSAMGKIVVQTGLFNLGIVTGLGKEKLWIQNC